ncbi:hypothetical protein CBM2634_P30045 [Cupriavidus taiwanensis]|uniref:Uncharacterized protein n=1 Tax=Cupriavidus taiwanensis TaxID=164546 RepID=A0A375JCL3_9BURK|nr:hypothetical protein CBM2634_P30045 [Cupriavidus taiwanensis]
MPRSVTHAGYFRAYSLTVGRPLRVSTKAIKAKYENMKEAIAHGQAQRPSCLAHLNAR